MWHVMSIFFFLDELFMFSNRLPTLLTYGWFSPPYCRYNIHCWLQFSTVACVKLVSIYPCRKMVSMSYHMLDLLWYSFCIYSISSFSFWQRKEIKIESYGKCSIITICLGIWIGSFVLTIKWIWVLVQVLLFL